MPGPRNPEPFENILDAVGWTPLVRLHRIARGIRTPVYGKAENLNPGGSVKDRIGLAIIEAAERSGALKPGGVIVEGTSGNTGVGLAIAAALKGYRCIFTIPDKMSGEKIRLLRAYGAEVIVVPTAVPPDHPEYYIQKAKAIVAATPGAILADQHYNPVNPEAHYQTTGPEIWEQTKGRVTHFVCSPGTGGTVSGAGRYLKEKNPKVKVIAGDPVGSIYKEYAKTHAKGQGFPYKVEGIGGDKIPTALHFDVFSALEVARQADDPNAMVVTILCDTGERYLSKLYDDAWMRENQMLESERVTAGQLLGRHPRDLPPSRWSTPTCPSTGSPPCCRRRRRPPSSAARASSWGSSTATTSCGRSRASARGPPCTQGVPGARASSHASIRRKTVSRSGSLKPRREPQTLGYLGPASAHPLRTFCRRRSS